MLKTRLMRGLLAASSICLVLLLVSSRNKQATRVAAVMDKVQLELVSPPVVAAAAPKIQQAPLAKPTAAKQTTAKPGPNKISIPQMGVDAELLEGTSLATLNKGIWHLPGTSDPIKGGNMVIAAHRYKWLPPNKKTFWHLDKLKKGDEFTLSWMGTTYRYRVSAISVVTPDKIEVLRNTQHHKLTLFTCTPKFSSKYRLVVEALPVSADTVVAAVAGS